MPHWSRSTRYPGYEQALIDGHLHTRPVAVLDGMAKDNVMQALSLFKTAQKVNHYLYFELAFTRKTDWMCWVIDQQGGERNVLFQGQAAEPNDACCGAVDVLTRLIDRGGPT